MSLIWHVFSLSFEWAFGLVGGIVAAVYLIGLLIGMLFE